MTKKRETELDILRILAMLAVILVHVCGIEAKTLPAQDPDWQVLVLLRGLVTWEVPVYIMISGRFFLDPERDVTGKKIARAVWRLAVAFVVWDAVYQLFYLCNGAYTGLNWKGILSEALAGPYHFWYLHMLIWLYAITPFLRRIAQDKRLMEYYIVLYLLFQFLTEYGPELPMVGSTIEAVLGKTNYYFTLGYSGYYILGSYLSRYGVPDKLEKPLYCLGGILLVLAAGGNMLRSVREGFEDTWYTQYLRPNVILEAVAVYTFFVKRVSKVRFSEKAVRWISHLAEHSFGVYLIHALVIEGYPLLGLKPTMLSPWLMVPLLSVLAYASSHLLVVLLRKLPRIGKRIT